MDVYIHTSWVSFIACLIGNNICKESDKVNKVKKIKINIHTEIPPVNSYAGPLFTLK